MEIDNLISALEKTLSLLRESESSAWARLSIEEIVRQIEAELESVKHLHRVDVKLLSYLFAPTGLLQETSIDNGWAYEFLEISEVIGQCIGA